MAAIAPGTRGLAKLAAQDKYRWVEAKDANTRYDWSAAYFNMVWSRVFFVLVMLILPVSLIAITPWMLMGYTALLVIPARQALASGKVHTNYVDNKAYEIVSQLKDGWRDHGEVFYKQIWDHTCNGAYCGYSYSDHYDSYGNPRPDAIKHTNCSHCERRLNELEALLESQQATELNIKGPLEEQLFESSEQFRKAVAEQSKPNEIMREISEGVTNGKDRKLHPARRQR